MSKKYCKEIFGLTEMQKLEFDIATTSFTDNYRTQERSEEAHENFPAVDKTPFIL